MVAVIVLGAWSSHGSNPQPSVTVRVLDAESFALYMRQIDGQKINVYVKDKDGSTLYSRSLRNKDTFSKKINLKELPAGVYSLEIRDNIGTLTYPIFLSETRLEIPVDERIATFNPIVRKDDKTVSLVLFSPSGHTHNLSIYNEKHELVHDEKINETINYQKQFDFSEALPGFYSIVINSQGHEYTYHLPVK